MHDKRELCFLINIMTVMIIFPFNLTLTIAKLEAQPTEKQISKEIIITFKNSSHLEWRVGLSDTILKGTHPGTIYAKFGSIWPSCFRGEDFFNISQSEKRINLGDHVCRPNGTKWRNFIEDLT